MGVVAWNGPQILSTVEAAAVRAMETAGAALATSTKARVSTPYPPASAPGEAPHLRSGGLHDAIGSQVTRGGRTVTLKVGVPADSAVLAQARALASGTGRMAARPFMDSAATVRAMVTEAVAGAVRSALH
jgi:hypothetical protein